MVLHTAAGLADWDANRETLDWAVIDLMDLTRCKYTKGFECMILIYLHVLDMDERNIVVCSAVARIPNYLTVAASGFYGMQMSASE